MLLAQLLRRMVTKEHSKVVMANNVECKAECCNFIQSIDVVENGQ